MASPAEIVRAWDRRKAREAAAARAKGMVSNDNSAPEPSGYLEIDGERMPYWLPVPAPAGAPVETEQQKQATA